MQNPTTSRVVNRAGFVRLASIGIGAFLLMQVVSSCAEAANTPPAQPLTLVISWDDPKHANLKVIGGYTVQRGVLVVHTKDDTYVAVSSACTFDNTQLSYRLSSNQFYCGSDGSNFDLKGIPVKGPATKPLIVHPLVINKGIGQFTITL